MSRTLTLPARTSSQYLYLWRRCAQASRSGIAYRFPPTWPETSRKPFSTHQRQQLETLQPAASVQDSSALLPPQTPKSTQLRSQRARDLPALCPGCGAHSQTVDPASAGYYDITRERNVRDKSTSKQTEDEIYRATSHQLHTLLAGKTPPAGEATAPISSTTPAVPICDRCHELLYHSRGTSIIHPSMQSIQAIIEDSPHKHNHIYHVLDAADFPMSLIPNLQHALNLPRLRTQNRRSKSIRYLRGRVAEVSFIVTRSDLLAPKKEQVDTLMPYLQEVLRDALGRSGKNVRLGNVRCVSAKRGWWTRTVKEEIYGRGGAAWMVGKVNVGKSALFEVVFPKGRNQEDVNLDRVRHQAAKEAEKQKDALSESPPSVDLEGVETRKSEPYQESEIWLSKQEQEEQDDEPLDEDEDSSLLPPAQPETAYPVMPLVSSLPGTTASPIRIPYGNGKGELIDLPGVHRSSLDGYVKAEHKKEMVMKSRIVPEQCTLKPGQSLLLGGLIRITPKTDNQIMLAYPFVPPAFEPHVTGTHKAIAIQSGIHGLESLGKEGHAYTGTVRSIATDEAKKSIQRAGTFPLQWNVTKRRAGPLTDRAAGKQKADNLPFIIYSADLLIEGVGWVELACQVRRRDTSLLPNDALSELDAPAHQLPEVEVFSPEGKFVGLRRPMNAWLLGGPKKVPAHARRERPRRSISMVKRRQQATSS